MFGYKKLQDSKYKIMLVAYKDLDERLEMELAYYFISSIKNKKGIKENIIASDKSSCGLSFRTGLYHKWFKETILKKLKEGYKFGIVETPKSYGNKDVKKLKELGAKYRDRILIVATEQL